MSKADLVVDAFLDGKIKSAGNMTSTGNKIYSYQMPLVERVEDMNGRFKYLVVKRENCPSNTTKRHLSAIMRGLSGRNIQEVEVI